MADTPQDFINRAKALAAQAAALQAANPVPPNTPAGVGAQPAPAPAGR